MPEAETDMHRSYVTDAEIRMASGGERTTVQVMTEDIARDGMVIRAEGVDTSSYMDNPVVLWNHGMGHDQPIARTVDMQRVDGGIRATVEWDSDEFSQEIKRKVKDGFLSAVSIGWRTEEAQEEEVDGRTVPVITRADMTEFSFVSVPADAGALVLQRSDDAEPLAQLEAKVDRLTEEIRALRSSEGRSEESSTEESSKRASATADPAPDSTSSPATAGGDADEDPDDVPTSQEAPEGQDAPAQQDGVPPRSATEEDYEQLVNTLVPLIRTSVKRQLGKA